MSLTLSRIFLHFKLSFVVVLFFNSFNYRVYVLAAKHLLTFTVTRTEVAPDTLLSLCRLHRYTEMSIEAALSKHEYSCVAWSAMLTLEIGDHRESERRQEVVDYRILPHQTLKFSSDCTVFTANTNTCILYNCSILSSNPGHLCWMSYLILSPCFSRPFISFVTT